MPSSSIYRKATEALTKQRIAIVESTEDVSEIEQQIGSGLAEELIHTAQDELSLAEKMIKWKPWEPLEETAPEVIQDTTCSLAALTYIKAQWETPLQRK